MRLLVLTLLLTSCLAGKVPAKYFYKCVKLAPSHTLKSIEYDKTVKVIRCNFNRKLTIDIPMRVEDKF